MEKINLDQGQIFTVGTSADLLYLNSGGSIDWARGTAKYFIQNIQNFKVLILKLKLIHKKYTICLCT